MKSTLLSTFAALSLMTVTTVRAADPLADLLVSKGVLTSSEAGNAATRGDLINALVKKGIITADEAASLENEKTKTSFVTTNELADMKDEVVATIREADGDFGMPKWLDGLTIKGDIRVRYEGFDEDNAKQRNRARVRARLGLEKKWDNGVKAGVKLATGSTGDPISTNQTFEGAANKNFNLDRAYVGWNPEFAEWLTVTGGRHENLLEGTNMVWDGDLNFEGVTEQAELNFSEDLRAFVNFGQYVLGESSGGTDSLLWAWQAGVGFSMTDVLGTVLAVGFYNYQNLAAAGDNGLNEQATDAGNSGAAGALTFEYRIIDIVSKWKLEVAEMPLGIWFNYAINTASDAGAVQLTEDTAWGVGAKLGKAKKKGSWDLSLSYKQIEADAVVAAFNDSDFLGTNREGITVGGKYQVLDNMSVGLTVISSEVLDTTFNSAENDYTRWQLDCIVKF
ncbi:MAG: putative porin [Planctomycetota bacterium]|nr:putative porin [Planctomycetota bacterium]